MSTSARGKRRGPGRPVAKRNGKSLHVYLDGALRATLDEAVGITRRDLTAEVTVALEKHFKEMGIWPRKETSPR